MRYCNPSYDWPGTGDFLATAQGSAEAATGGGWRSGTYLGQAAAVTNLWGAAAATGATPVTGRAWELVPYPAATGMLAEVVPKGTRGLASTCYWKNKDTVVVAPKNGAAALFASVSAIAFGAAVLAI